MELTDKEKDIKNKALQYIKDNKAGLIEKFADKDDHSPKEAPVSFFMAGSFGAGKTEFSRQLKKQFPDVVLIDADEIRKLCPNYSGEKAYLFNVAAFVGQDILHSYVLKNSQDFVFDSTFRNHSKMKQNIERSLKRGRPVEVYYVYQHPKVAWLFTKVREKLQGRHISKESFIDSCYESRRGVNKIKSEFGNSIQINLVRNTTTSDISDVEPDNLQDYTLEELKSEVERRETISDIQNIDNHVPYDYSRDKLTKLL